LSQKKGIVEASRSQAGHDSAHKGAIAQRIAPNSFLTSEANEVVRPIHSKAMPVILMTDDAREAWLNAPLDIALGMQRPCPKDTLRIVARNE
jgi:putative SOS response-associated peptidase YedK